MDGVRKVAIRLGDGVEVNYEETKRMRWVLVGQADASLRVMEASGEGTRKQGQ